MNLTPAVPNAGPVLFYESHHYYLSNFSAFAVEWRGRVWPTSEHAYQASKFFESAPEVADRIFAARSAHDTKVIAKENAGKIPANWDTVKLAIMTEIVSAKLAQHPWIQKKLAETGSRTLIEASHKDPFWGWGPDGNGRNELGRIWMGLRDTDNPR
jgi:ribA/ribD-fused uncharacterized protein